MIGAGSQGVIRGLNRLAVFQLVKHEQHVTRSDLAQGLGLASSTIRVIVDELLSEGWLSETLDDKPRPRGRRPLRLQVSASRLVVLGAEINGTQVTVLAASPQGDIRDFRVIETNRDVTQALDVLAIQLKEIHARLTSSGLRVCGIGVAVPGGVSPREGRLILSERNGWRDVPFKQDLMRRLQGHDLADCPLLVCRAINCRAAYYQNSVSPPAGDPLLYVHVGAGVSVAFLNGSDVLTGTNGMAGQLSHFSVGTDGLRCTCGRQGCAQMVASLRAIEQRLKMRVENIRTLVAAGDLDVKKVVSETAEALACVIHEQFLLLDPAEVFVGGPVFKVGVAFYHRLQTRFDELGRQVDRRAARLRLVREEPSGPAKGAAMQVVPHALKGIRN